MKKIIEKLATLPVASKAEDIVSSVINGVVTVLSSATGSGKTLYATSLLAEKSSNQVVVCVPRRFLAVNAAETIAEIAELKTGQEVGYCVGKQSGEESKRSHNTKLLFVTYGYAISSGLVTTASTIVLDEVHEASMDMSIVRALLHRRLANGDAVKVLEMSATINAGKQAAYWGQVSSTKIFEVEGKTFLCDRRWARKMPHEAVLDLIQEGRKGILVFRPGVGEVQETARYIEQLAKTAELQVDVSTIYGEMDAKERRKAVSKPAEGSIKVLVGTNVVESGANISWLDSGVSCGTGKELVTRDSGAVGLDLINLSKWRLEQQEGRVKRFREGVFVLCSGTEWDERSAETIPELVRLPLTELVMHCAIFGLKTEDLSFDVVLGTVKVQAAETKLQRLGLLDAECKLTKAGKFVSNMPVSPEVGALLWHAKNTQCLGAALSLASVIEVGGVRKNFRFSHGLDKTSDWLDSLSAFKMAYAERDNKQRKQLMEQHNIGYKRFEGAKAMLRDLRSRFNGDASSTMEATPEQLRRCIAAGWADRIFRSNGSLITAGSFASQYEVGRGSSIERSVSTDLMVGDLRTIMPRNGNRSFTVLEKVTEITLEDIEAVAKVNKVMLSVETSREKSGYYAFQDVTTYKLFGEYEVGVKKVESRLSTEEEAEKADFEAQREELKAKLAETTTERELLGMDLISFSNESFSIGWMNTYSYTEESILEVLSKHQQQVTEKREQLRKAVIGLAKRIAHFNIEVTLVNDVITSAGQNFGLSSVTVNQLREQVETAEHQRDTVEGRKRLEALNERRKALDLPLFILSDESFHLSGYFGYYYNNLPQIDHYEAETSRLESEITAEKETERRSSEKLNDLLAKFSK